ncbi:AMP-binding protein [Nocardioides sp. dk4132]|uniref:class I adenylate-forming enzyme family protein n=1 Tax=unclassified Nocardioides TaxID=2615069 RepID=UPI001295B475|nr:MULTISPECIES: fatty acid--CoA ligase family protein [unclassified Nocardioides]MQW77589.1 AMP-binding protein [Nocardioides sp. dk4132]QGA06117.1 AMP-binding protein [Nocardioides sp. dk884]
MDLLTLLEMTAGGMGERVLLGRRQDGLTAQALRDRSAAAGVLFAGKDAEKVLYLGGNGPAFAIALFGAAAAHKPFLPLNYRLADEQLEEILRRHTGLLIAEDTKRARTLAPAATEVISTDDVLAILSDPDAPIIPADIEDIAVLLMTSGTTAAPKSAVLRHHHLTSYVMQTVEFAGADEQDATIVSVPPYHIAAVANLLSNLYAGRRIVYLDRFTAEDWVDIVTEEAITNAMVVPTMLARIVRHLEETGRKGPATLKGLSYGGAKVPPTVLEAALALFPTTGFVNAYGLTETSSSIAVLGPEDHRAALAATDPRERARIGSVGRVLPGVEATIRDSAGNEVPANTPGEIYVRGAQVAGEYLEQGSKLVGEGWFPTRDRGWLDEEGFLFVEGRADDTIIRGGENIAPAEIEDVLVRHDAVLEVCVAGVPDEEWGNAIAVFVVVKDGRTCTEDEIKAFARGHLRGSKTPDRVYFLPELPATPTGKILRKDLVASVS